MATRSLRLSSTALALAGGLLLLLFLLTSSVGRAQDSGAIEHPENSKDAVATFTADDPEGGTSITWEVVATAPSPLPTGFEADDFPGDATHFDISKGGVLTFDIGGDDDVGDASVAPDFEAPRAAAFDSATNTNTYNVVVSASDGTVTGYHKVTVKVTDVDEPGKVTWTVDHAFDGSSHDATRTPKLVQFQVGASLMASATDGDTAGTGKAVTAPIWRWYRAPDKVSEGTLIDGADEARYTVALDDVGMYVRAVAHYVVAGNVDQETAMLTSDYPVLAERIGNNKLKFDPSAISRSVAEGDKGRNVGAPVTATGNHGKVNYTIVAGGDAASFEIDQETGQITTAVKLDYEAAPGAGNCTTTQNECSVTVRATDATGSATVAGTPPANTFADATVTINITNVDEKPTFPTAALTAISRPENMTALSASGEEATVTYTAMDPESRNIAYTLMGPDAAKFKLSRTQVLSFKAEPDYEMRADQNRDNVYEVTVRASDGTMHADRAVKVTITGVNEAPAVTGRDSVNHPENSKGTVATFTARDPEGSTSITWGLLESTASAPTGTDIVPGTDSADSDHFDIGSKDGVLTFDIGGDADDPDDSDPPDFEAPRAAASSGTNTNTYRVVVSASDGTETGYHEVTVKVTNVAEKGKVTWTVDHDASGTGNDPKLVQFDVGTVLRASATDGDIAGIDKAVAAPGASNLIWRWQRGSSNIRNAETSEYTVAQADVGHIIRVVATYNVGGSTQQETASLSSDYPVLANRVGVNKLKFDPSAISRSVAEGDKGRNVGAPVRATGNHGAVNYTFVPGGDAAKFAINQKTGQITTAVKLDKEAAAGDDANCAALNSCTVTVRATDASGTATDATAAADPPIFVDATVTIKITDADEKPTFITDSTGPPAAESPETITVPENSKALFSTTATTGFTKTTEVAVTYAATDQDGLNVNLSLMGPDAADFSLSSTGVLSFVKAPDYENPADANRDNLYEVTVRASDGTMHADRKVRVTVENVNEAPMIIAGGLAISGSRSESVAENTTAVGTYTAAGPKAANAAWTLSGDDSGDFSISRSGVLTFATAPDYENPADADTNNVYLVTVVANDGENTAEREVTVTVTNVNEPGTLTVSPDTPIVGSPVSAPLGDDDGIQLDTITHQWAIGDGTDFTDIAGATSHTYTPVEADAGKFLQVTVTYTDDANADNTLVAVSTNAVTAGDPLVVQYDANGNGEIEKVEVIAAINDYLNGGANAPSKADVIKLINLYLGD